MRFSGAGTVSDWWRVLPWEQSKRFNTAVAKVGAQRAQRKQHYTVAIVSRLSSQSAAARLRLALCSSAGDGPLLQICGARRTAARSGLTRVLPEWLASPERFAPIPALRPAERAPMPQRRESNSTAKFRISNSLLRRRATRKPATRQRLRRQLPRRHSNFLSPPIPPFRRARRDRNPTQSTARFPGRRLELQGWLPRRGIPRARIFKMASRPSIAFRRRCAAHNSRRA